MKYPVQLTDLENGLSIYIPNPALVKPTYEQLMTSNAAEPFPFWAKLWASSKALTKFLIEQPNWVTDKRILEIGAGIGQPSFTIASKATEVIISDYNRDAVELINTNIDYSASTNAKGIIVDWNGFDYSIKADVILLSDINYAPNEFKPLLQVIEHYISKDAVIIIATPQRIMGVPFIEGLQVFIKHTYVETIIEKGSEVIISIYVLYK
jgi:predicted nicotinamide N-methyase